jgi:hypothetical protein
MQACNTQPLTNSTVQFPGIAIAFLSIKYMRPEPPVSYLHTTWLIENIVSYTQAKPYHNLHFKPSWVLGLELGFFF